ncbi:alpha/beta hydrolase [Leifsonia sp. NPDC058292]|uniref:alpha/beta hydrolase n=1 Tax=Leifsonia sp. NPDC058292 TaxID=3346428 RepID=UPI0036DA85FE
MPVDVTNPGAGEPAAIRHLAIIRARKATELRDVHATVTAAQATVTDSGWSGKAQVAFLAAMNQTTPDLFLLANGLDAQATALRAYAEALVEIKHEQKRLEARRNTAEQAITDAQAMQDHTISPLERDVLALTGADPTSTASLRRLEETIDTERAALRKVQRDWEDLLARRHQANTACVTALTGTSALGRTAPFLRNAIVTATPTGLLSSLTSLSATDLAILLKFRPGLAATLASADPATVAAWWTSMNSPTFGTASPAQAALIAALPGVIGTLEGVAYWSRHQANTTVLDRALETASAPGGDPEQLKALRALKTAVRGGMDEAPPRQLMSLTLEPAVGAALSIGDLDKAEFATYLVPGMGTTVAGDIGAYKNAATNLRDAQGTVASHPTGSSAVIAWLDYFPPGSTDVVGVKTDDSAKAGALRLADSLNGLHAVYASQGRSPEISLVGHSYGSTVAAIALTSASVDHFVMLGSAGISTTIDSAAALNVPLGEVFASQAHHDGWAPTGQALSGRQDPTAPGFDTEVFSSEAAVDAHGKELYEVTQHGPFGAPGDPESRSYFDRNTTSLYNTALVTTGRGAATISGGTPADRLALQSRDRLVDWMTKGIPWAAK